MLVVDRIELRHNYAAKIGTSEYRLSSEPCGHTLNSCERSGSVYDKKPISIRSRASQKRVYYPWVDFLMHYSCSGRCTLC
jgi:hypothetical protein